MNRSLIALLTLLAAAGTGAAEYGTVQPAGSALTFVSRQMGVPVDGSFGKYTARISFDPAKPEAGQAQIEVDLASIDTGSSDANDEVRGKAWFNVHDFPTAKFVSSGVKALGGGHFQALGRMTIKGRSADLVAPFTARATGAAVVLEGSLPISRQQYGIGEGSWSDPTVVADEVQIRFRFTLGAGKK